MAVEMKFISKKEGVHMAKMFKLAERTHVYVDPKTKEERIADLKKDKDNIFLLGAAGSEIEPERAEALGLTKAAKAEKSKAEDKA